ncbi:hypothetical protein JHK86_035999 [Glycine max]|nr:hypothetical protein JHK86_035999 [Glycine max]
MTILTNTVQPECLLLSPRMPRRILRGPMEFISGNLRTFSYFDFRTLRRATKNFHPRNLLGSGGFGPVYQGKLADGRLKSRHCLLTSLNKEKKNFWQKGYTAPEYAIRGELSEKADIYCFGVLVLEIISCRKNTLPSEQQYLPEYAWKLYEKSMLVEIVNPKLREHGIEEKDVMQTFHVALLCL